MTRKEAGIGGAIGYNIWQGVVCKFAGDCAKQLYWSVVGQVVRRVGEGQSVGDTRYSGRGIVEPLLDGSNL